MGAPLGVIGFMNKRCVEVQADGLEVQLACSFYEPLPDIFPIDRSLEMDLCGVWCAVAVCTKLQERIGCGSQPVTCQHQLGIAEHPDANQDSHNRPGGYEGDQFVFQGDTRQ